MTIEERWAMVERDLVPASPRRAKGLMKELFLLGAGFAQGRIQGFDMSESAAAKLQAEFPDFYNNITNVGSEIKNFALPPSTMESN